MATSKPTPISSGRSRAGGGGTHVRPDAKYRPEAFIVPGSDQNGNSLRVWCRVVPLLDRAIDVLFGSHKFPFKSKGDLVRWCIKRGVEELNGMEPMVGSTMAQVNAIMALLRDEQAKHEFLTLFNTMSAAIGDHIQAQALGEARRMVSEVRHLIMGMQDGYWRGRYIKELEDRFGHLLSGKSVAGAGVGSHTDSGPDIDTEGEEDE